MTDFTNYWISIEESIDNQRFTVAISTWKTAVIKLFMDDVYEVVSEICESDTDIATLLSYARNGANPSSFGIIQSKAFKEIFRDQVSSGKVQTRNIFAVYIGYKSADDHIRSNDIKENEPEAPLATPIQINTDTFSQIHSWLNDQRRMLSHVIFELLSKLNGRMQKGVAESQHFGIDYFAYGLDDQGLDEAYGFQNYNGAALSTPGLHACLLKIENVQKYPLKIFAYTFICNASFSKGQRAKIEVALQKLVQSQKVTYEVSFIDLKEFLLKFQQQIYPNLRDELIIANQNYDKEFIRSMEQLFYLKEIPFVIENDALVRKNPLSYLMQDEYNQKEARELMLLLSQNYTNQKNNNFTFIISEFGFGKTSLLLNIFKSASLKSIDSIFIPIAQLPQKAFTNDVHFCRELLNLLHNKINQSENKSSSGLMNQKLNFYDESDIFISLLILTFKELLETRSDLILMLDGLDEHFQAYSYQGLNRIFNTIHSLNFKCIISVREEFWNDKSGNIQLALENLGLQPSLFLKEWGDQEIRSYLDQYRSQVALFPSQVKRIQKFLELVRAGNYKQYYGDIPKRPLFLNMLTQDIINGTIEKKNLSQLYRSYLNNKFSIDIQRAFKDNLQLKSIALLQKEDKIKVLDRIFSVLEQTAAIMIIQSESHDAILQSVTTENKLENFIDELKENKVLLTEILLHSVLIPFGKRATSEEFKLKFAHKSFQEYFTARHLFGLIKQKDLKKNDYQLFELKYGSSVGRFLFGMLEEEENKIDSKIHGYRKKIAAITQSVDQEESIGRLLYTYYLKQSN